MRKIASIGFAIGALAVTALSARADDQSISFATGAIGGAPLSGYAGDQPAQRTLRQSAVRRAAPADAYGAYAQDGGYSENNCTYVGGPKSSLGWTCW